jgi:hypothetical protein
MIKNFASVAEPLFAIKRMSDDERKKKTKAAQARRANKALRPEHRRFQKPEPPPFVWSEACSAAFETLKRALVHDVVLAYPDWNKPFKIQSDASDVALGAVLSQMDQSGVERPVAFGSWSLSPAERRYSAQERECLAILRAVTHWRMYVVGQKFTVETDHESLKWLWTTKHENARVLRWVLQLQEYDFDVIYRKGVMNENA